MKLFIFIFLFGFAWSVDWESQYQDVCARDGMCTRLKSDDGTWLPPKPEIIAMIKTPQIQDQIQSMSKKYGVDPTSVAGAIMAENSLNVGVKDEVQTWLAAKMGISNIAGKNFTFGLGQIGLPAAREAEDHIAKIEKRTPKSDEQLIQEIADPVGSIRIAATIMRKVQDDYKAQGIDISKDPAVMASLYNLGQSEDRAKATKASGHAPRVNYFGLFVQKNTPEIQRDLSLNAVTSVGAADPTLGAVNPVRLKSGQLIKADYATRSLPLVSSPSTCQSEEFGQDISEQTKSLNFGSPVGVLEKGNTYREISRGLDCNSKVWKLVQSSDGTTGWVAGDQLDKVHGSRLDDQVKCSSQDSDCAKKLSTTLGDKVVTGKSATQGVVFAKPVGTGPHPTFEHEDQRCGYVPPKTDDDGNGISNRNSISSRTQSQIMGSQTQPEKTNQEILSAHMKNANDLNVVLDHMSAQTGIARDQLEQPDNPYNSLAQNLNEKVRKDSSCVSSVQNSDQINCEPIMNPKFLMGYKFSKSPSLNELNGLGSILYPDVEDAGAERSSLEPTAMEVKNTPDQDVKDSIESCVADSAKIQAALDEKAKALERSAKTSATPPCPKCGGGLMNPSLGYPTGPYPRSGMGMGMATGMGYGTGYSARGFASWSGPMDYISQVGQVSKKATSAQFADLKQNLMTFAKICHSRLNLREKPSSRSAISCTHAPKYVTNVVGTFNRDLVAKMYQQDPSLVLQDVQSQGIDVINRRDIMHVLGSPQPIRRRMYGEDRGSDPAHSYCPNKTAEYIQNLLDSNPCIRHIYVPTKFLSNKLSGVGSKVIYHAFEDNDRYAIETGDGSCK